MMKNFVNKTSLEAFDIPILISSFVRYNSLKDIIDFLSLIRPKFLVLVSDGPRNGYALDLEKIIKCRNIFESIDWSCEIDKLYYDSNVGILKSAHESFELAFKKYDKLIIIEDDIQLSYDFFVFSREMLLKYENDNRVLLISGANPFPVNKSIDNDYFFSTSFLSGGICYWKRTFESLKITYELLISGRFDRDYLSRILSKYELRILNDLIESPMHFSFEKMTSISLRLNNQLGIIPKSNLISYKTNSDDSAHSYSDSRYFTKEIRDVLNYPLESINYPICHPYLIINDTKANLQYMSINAIGNKYIFKQLIRYIYTSLMLIKDGKFLILWQRIKRFYRSHLRGRYDKDG